MKTCEMFRILFEDFMLSIFTLDVLISNRIERQHLLQRCIPRHQFWFMTLLELVFFNTFLRKHKDCIVFRLSALFMMWNAMFWVTILSCILQLDDFPLFFFMKVLLLCTKHINGNYNLSPINFRHRSCKFLVFLVGFRFLNLCSVLCNIKLSLLARINHILLLEQ